MGVSSGASEYIDPPNPFYSPGEGLNLITCVDVGARSPIKSFEDYSSIYDELVSSSLYAGRTLAMSNAVFCAGVAIPQPESQTFSGKLLPLLSLRDKPPNWSC
jgi:hypothetical protein